MLEGIIFRSTRIGKDGEPFTLYKIRTMHKGAEDLHMQTCSNGRDHNGKPKDDPRVIPSRKWLRRYFIDEVPQVLNILKGDMKLVGVRPQHPSEFAQRSSDFQHTYLCSKPGMMGVAYVAERKTIEDIFSAEESYLSEYGRKPLKTDIKYFFRLAYKILFCGVRSS